MIFKLTERCPKCGKEFNARIPRRWYMRLIPFTKRYHCQNCDNDYMVNLWGTILLIPITIPITFLTWALWDLSGLRFFWQKIRPPVDSAQLRRPASTFSIWVAGIFLVYLILFNFASQRYERRIELIENRVNATLPLLTILDIDERKNALRKISKIQNITYPAKPNIYEPMSIFHTFFAPVDHKYEEMIVLLKNTIAKCKDYFDSINLEKADLRNPNLQESELNNHDISVSNFIGAYLSNANHPNLELRGNLGEVIVEE